jgi:hypothetical protein
MSLLSEINIREMPQSLTVKMQLKIYTGVDIM